jgi:hypothetical protein
LVISPSLSLQALPTAAFPGMVSSFMQEEQAASDPLPLFLSACL